jgi:hypothetical protein
MATKAQLAEEKVKYMGLTRAEAAAFFLLRRYMGAEAKYKTVRKYKRRFIEEGLLTEDGQLPEHLFKGEWNDRFTEKGHALTKVIAGEALAPVEEAFKEIDLRTRLE